MWPELRDFLASILLYHFALAAGCGLTVAIALCEKYLLHREISVKAYTALTLALFVFACFQAWQVEHESRIARESELVKSKQETISEAGDKTNERKSKENCQGLLEVSQQRINDISGHSVDQQSQTQQSQSKVQECLLELGKALKPEPRKVITLIDLDETKGRTRYIGEIIALVNRPMPYISTTIKCNGKLLGLQARLAGGTSQWGLKRSGVLPSGSGFLEATSTPAWSPERPLVFTVFFDDPKLETCEVILEN